MSSRKRLVISELKFDTSGMDRFIEFIWPDILGGSTDEALDGALGEGVKVSKKVVWKDTRSLMKSIRRWKSPAKKAADIGPFRHGGIRAGGYIVNPKTGKLVNYAAIIEAAQRMEEGKGYVERGLETSAKIFPILFKRAVKRRLKR